MKRKRYNGGEYLVKDKECIDIGTCKKDTNDTAGKGDT